MMNDYETVEVKKHEYEDILRDSRLLQSLYAAGIDNWEGMYDAVEIFYSDYPEYKDADD